MLILRQVSPNVYSIIEEYSDVDINLLPVAMGRVVMSNTNLTELNAKKAELETEIDKIQSYIDLIEEVQE